MPLEHPAALLGAPIDWGTLEAILVIRPDNLGDVVMAGPALRALRRAAPRARLDLLVAPAGAQVATLLPEVDGVLSASVSWQQISPEDAPVADDFELAGRIAAGSYDAAVILTSFTQSPWPAAYLCRLAGVPLRVGMSGEFGGVGLTHWVPAPPNDLHQVDRGLHLLERVGVPPVEARLALRIPPDATRAARQALAARGLAAGQAYALILPGASCPSRRYPLRRFAEVAALLADAGLAVVVCGTAKEAPLVAEVAERVPTAVTLSGVLDVAGLAAAIAASTVVVCNNSGGAHLASAVGAPVVDLFAGTERIVEYEPRFTPAAVLTVATLCSPCRQFTCPYSLECLDIAPGHVAAQALALAEAGAR